MSIGDPFSEFGGSAFSNNPFKEFGGDVINPNTTDTLQKKFYANYMSSPIYKQRLNNFDIKDKPDISNILNTNISHITGVGSKAMTKDVTANNTIKTAGFPIKQGLSNVNIDNNQLGQINKQYNVNTKLDDVVAHELSHVSRQLTPKEEEFIASMNKQKIASDLFKEFKKQGPVYDSKTLKPAGFSEWLSNSYEPNPAVHDSSPNEIKADLDALRFQMQKKGIYDVSKRNMSADDFKKATQDKDIQNSVEFKRLMQRFNPNNIIKLNNTIALNYNKSNGEQGNMA